MVIFPNELLVKLIAEPTPLRVGEAKKPANGAPTMVIVVECVLLPPGPLMVRLAVNVPALV